MKQADIIFDSRDEYFKSPAGAVKADTQLTFRILVSKEVNPLSARLVIRYDRHDAPAHYDMAGGTETPVPTDDYVAFTTTFTIHDTGLYWYGFEVLTDNGILQIGKDYGKNIAIITEDDASWQQTVYQRAYDVPDWICGGVYYHIVVDRFHPSGRKRLVTEGKILRRDWGGTPEWRPQDGHILNNDFFGGDLEGIRQKLPYLADLGVTCLYLSPVFEAYSNHKYDTANYEKIDPMFGSEEDFRNLCEAASECGIRVICDGVFAHTGSDSIYFDRFGRYASKTGVPGAYRHPDSPYRDWYFFHEDESYDCWWDFKTLPKLNKRNAEYTEYMTGENGIVRRWLRSGAAGWRLDVADELPNDFLDAIAHAAKSEKSDALLVGEVWEDASSKIAYDERKNYFEGNRLDAVMNYPFRTAIIDFVRHGKSEALAQTVESIVENYPPEVLHCLMNVLSTHDSVRIITALAGKDLGTDPPRNLQAITRMNDKRWEHGIRLLKIASLIQMTLPGVPSIYYGDEAGTEGYKDPFNRTCFPWGRENADLLAWYKKIIQIRLTHEIYKTGSYRTIESADGLYAFERFDDAHASIMTVANCGETPHRFSLEGAWTDLLDGQKKTGTFTVFPGEVLLLERS